jgi:dipeptidyl aminopeptidase/acylaminoacyl peptidase
LASQHKLVKKVVAISAVTDWRVDSETEPMEELASYMNRAFGQAYRFSKKNWDKLSKGLFYNPITQLNMIDKNKILLVHGTMDEIVPFSTAQDFENVTRVALLPVKTSDHMGLRKLMGTRIWKRVMKHLKD